MKFFIDQNLGPELAEGLRVFGEDVIHLKELFPEDTPDCKWLTYIGKNNYFLITRDRKFRYKPAEKRAFRENNVGAFLLFGKDRTKWDLIQQLIRNWLRIKEFAQKTKRPFAFRIPPNGTKITKISID